MSDLTPTTQKETLAKQKEIVALEKEIAELQKAKAEAQQKTAEAEKGALLAKFPKAETQGLEGTTTTDEKFGYVAEFAAYEAILRSLDLLSDKIKKDVLQSHPENNRVRILVVNDLDFAAGDVARIQIAQTMEKWDHLFSQQTENNENVRRETRDQALAGVGQTAALLTSAPVAIVLQSLISNMANLASYFQADFNVTGRNVDPVREAIIHHLLDQIKELNPTLFKFHLLERSSSVQCFVQLLEGKQSLIESQARLKIDGIEQLVARIERDTGHLQRYVKDLQKSPANTNLEKEIERLNTANVENKSKLAEARAADNATTILIAAFDKFIESVTKPPDQTELPLLAKVALRDFIYEMHVTHLLWIKPVSSGGESITKKQLFRSGHVSYLGGGVISYVLAARDGTIVSSGTTSALSQISHVLSTNRDYRLKYVTLEERTKNWLERLLDWLNI